MDKHQLKNLLTRYTQGTAEEAEELIALQREYPYCQLFYTLSARVAKDQNIPNHEHQLQLAAIHAADRSVLKEVVTAQPATSFVDANPAIAEIVVATQVQTEVTVDTLAVEPSTAEVIEVVEHNITSQAHTTERADEERHVNETKPAIKSIDRSIADVDVADELMRDLEKLNSSKHNFEMLLVEYSELKPRQKKQEPTPELSRSEEKREEKKATQEKADKQKSKSEKPAKSKRQRIIELARSKNATNELTRTQAEKHKAGGKKKAEADVLIENIATSKEEIVPESERQKEQMAIINQFIKASPSISSAKERPNAPVGDLNPIKSGEFGDNIVSETLVEILIKQGKKDKAIEVLKKLIWKYPQKKTYFASQIEELKK